MALYLGLDIGGTKSRWDWLADGLDQVGVQGGQGEGIQAGLLGPAAAGRRLGELLQRIGADVPAGERVAQVVAGMAGAGDPVVAGQIATAAVAVGPGWPLRVAGDIEVAAGCALDSGPGVAVWAGTGSFAVARDADGALHRAGGRGYLLSDEGSAHDLVIRAGRAALRGFDGIGPETELLQRFCDALKVTAPGRLGVALQDLPANQRAPLARQVMAAVEARDGVAMQVVAEGAQALATLVDGVREVADLEAEGLTVVRGGGMFGLPSRYGGDLDYALEQFDIPKSRLCAAEASLGAARLALAVARGEAPLCHWVPTAQGADGAPR